MNIQVHFCNGPAEGKSFPTPGGTPHSIWIIANGEGGWQPSSVEGQGVFYKRIAVETVGKERSAYYRTYEPEEES